MSYRAWIVAVAIGLIALSGQAQQQEGETDRAENAEQHPAYSSPDQVTVDVVVSQAEADTRKRQEEESRQREIRDLAAQEGMNAATQQMNAATQDMRNYALYSTILVGIGTVLLLYTLFLTRQANRAAQDAVTVTREVARDQTRAYVHMSGVTWNVKADTDGNRHIRFTFKVSNSGLTPCPRFEIRAAAFLRTPDGSRIDDRANIAIDFLGWNALPAGETFSGPIPVSFIDTEESIINRDPMTSLLVIYGEIRYLTIYGERFESEFEFMSKGGKTGRGVDHGDEKMSRTPRNCLVFKPSD